MSKYKNFTNKESGVSIAFTRSLALRHKTKEEVLNFSPIQNDQLQDELTTHCNTKEGPFYIARANISSISFFRKEKIYIYHPELDAIYSFNIIPNKSILLQNIVYIIPITIYGSYKMTEPLNALKQALYAECHLTEDETVLSIGTNYVIDAIKLF